MGAGKGVETGDEAKVGTAEGAGEGVRKVAGTEVVVVEQEEGAGVGTGEGLPKEAGREAGKVP